MAKTRVLLDSCVIIEAFRTKCWKALCNHFEVETVDCCVTECCTGDPLKPNRTPVPRDELLAGLSVVHNVDAVMLAALQLDHSNLPALDDGELHIMAWLNANPKEAIVTAISTSDRAAVRATYVLKLLDRVRSLQDLARSAGVGKNQLERLESHFLENWLSTLRLQLTTGIK